jgi:hypothetical protein
MATVTKDTDLKKKVIIFSYSLYIFEWGGYPILKALRSSNAEGSPVTMLQRERGSEPLSIFLFRQTYINMQGEIAVLQRYLRERQSPPLACRAHELKANWDTADTEAASLRA